MSEQATESRASRALDDPTYQHTRREATVILTAWVVCLIWTVGYCWFAGYGAAEGGEVKLTLGMPSWVFWGVALPWATALTFSVVYALWFIADDDLGELEGEAGAAPKEGAEPPHEAAGAGDVAGEDVKGGGDV